MPFILLAAGILMLVVGVRGTQDDFIKLIKEDFSGQGNFIVWILAIFVVGAIGYIPKMQTLSRLFLVLLLLTLIISNKGFFTSFQQQVFNRPKTATP